MAEEPDSRSGKHTGGIQAQVRAARSDLESQVAHVRAELDYANELIKQRTGRDLILAIVIAVAIGAVVLAALLFVKWVFMLLVLGIAAASIFELRQAFTGAGRRIDIVPQLIGAVLLIAAAYFWSPWLVWISLCAAISLVIVWRAIGQMMASDGRVYGDVLSDILTGALIQIYVSFFAAVCILLLVQVDGQLWILGFVIIAVAADTGAYATGITLGRRKGARLMAPRISPKKTWDGFGGAVVAALAAGVLLALFLLNLPWWAGLIFGAGILLSATFGDLAESMIKRDLGIKDMSSWIPGHGGVLDRLDSMLPSTAVALGMYYLLSPLTLTLT